METTTEARVQIYDKSNGVYRVIAEDGEDRFILASKVHMTGDIDNGDWVRVESEDLQEEESDNHQLYRMF